MFDDLTMRARSLFHRRGVEKEMDEELKLHLEREVGSLVAAGSTREEAVRRARREFGGLDQIREECRDARGVRPIESLVQDLRYGARILLKSPGFTLVVVLTLALGIGANTAIFSVVDALLIRPLPFPEAERIAQIWHVPPARKFPGVTRFSVSAANYLDWRGRNHVFEAMAVYGGRSFSFMNGDGPEALSGASVSSDFFRVLGAHARIGRDFLASEEEPGHDKVVLLSDALWRTRFNADPGVVGRAIRLSGDLYTVIGVMDPSCSFPANVALWSPLAWSAADRGVRGNHNFAVVARLRPGVEMASAQQEMNAISTRLEQEYPDDDRGWGAVVVPIREELFGQIRPALLVLFGGVTCVLLIACANVANLVLARTMARRRVLALRSALGASRARVLRQVLTETVLLSVSGGAAGLLLAEAALRWMESLLADNVPLQMEMGLDGRVLAFALALSITTGLAAGLAASWRLTRSDPIEGLREGPGRSASDAGGRRTRAALVVAEVALSLVLLIGAGLMIRTLASLRGVDPGLDVRNVLTMTVNLPFTKYATPAPRIAFFDRALARVRALPGVESAGAVDSLPLLRSGSAQPVAVEGLPPVPMSEQPEVAVRVISPGYMRSLRIPIREGRDFSDADAAGGTPVVLISEAMAKQLWPGEDPLGRRVTLTFVPGIAREIVGVVADVKLRGVDLAEPVPTLYWPQAQAGTFRMSLVVRAAARPGDLAPAVTAAIREVDPELPVLNRRTMDAVLDGSFSQQETTMLLLGAFGSLAVLLAGLGIYSVLSYGVRQRGKEIGIRMALGARSPDVLRLVMGEGLRLTMVGLALGAAAAVPLTRLLRDLLFGVTPTDPVTFIAVAAGLCAVALAACYLPARRATRVDPMLAIRTD